MVRSAGENRGTFDGCIMPVLHFSHVIVDAIVPHGLLLRRSFPLNHQGLTPSHFFRRRALMRLGEGRLPRSASASSAVLLFELFLRFTGCSFFFAT